MQRACKVFELVEALTGLPELHFHAWKRGLGITTRQGYAGAATRLYKPMISDDWMRRKLQCLGGVKRRRKRKTLPDFNSALKRAKELGADLTVGADGSMTFKFATSSFNGSGAPMSDLDHELEEFEKRHGSQISS